MKSWVYNLGHPPGGVCLINGKNALTTFSAILKSITPVSGGVDSRAYVDNSMSKLRSLKYKATPGGIQTSFYVFGSTKELCDLNTSRLIAECFSCVIHTDQDSFEYDAALTSHHTEPTGVDFYNLVELEFLAIRRFPLTRCELDFRSSLAQGFVNPGTVASGMRVMLMPEEDIPLLQFQLSEQEPISVTGLLAGQVFVIDGIEGEVLCNGINKFGSTDLIDFPKALPGENQVTVTGSQPLKARVEFYPVFIV